MEDGFEVEHQQSELNDASRAKHKLVLLVLQQGKNEQQQQLGSCCNYATGHALSTCVVSVAAPT